jgi:hypothetical protein
MSKLRLQILVLALGLAACTAKYGADDGLMTLKVRVDTPDAQLGTEGEPLPFVAGQMCTPDAPECPADQACVTWCNESGLACAADDDCPGQYELCLGACVTHARVSIEAIGNFGDRVPFTGFLTVKAVPGFVPPPASTIAIKNGVAENVEVWFARGVGPTWLWVEDTGYKARSGAFGECNDGLDNDENGVTDLADPGCRSADDAVEHAVTGVAGVADKPLTFENPTLRHLQYTSSIATGPLEGQDVRIDHGRLVVTNVTSSGLFVTDLDYHVPTLENGEPGYYNSLFLYSYSTPSNITYGDALCWVAGGVLEHEGNTQLNMPTFLAYYGNPDEPECKVNPRLDPEAKVPDPIDVTDLLQAEDPTSTTTYAATLYANAVALEPFENGLVKVNDLRLSTRFLACDANGNGTIDYDGDEDSCRTECQNDPLCTQLEGFFDYKQYGAFAAGKKKLEVSGEMLVEFSPLRIEFVGQDDRNGRCTLGAAWIGDTRFVQYTCPERTLKSVSGNLRHLYLCGPSWSEDRCSLQFHTLVPRFDDDIVEEETGDTP